MSRGDIKAGAAYVELLLKDRGFSQGLAKASQKLKSFGTGMSVIGGAVTAAGAAITGPFLLAVKQFADAGSTLADMSARTGMSVESLSELQFAAEQTGASIEYVEKAVRTMAKKGFDVADFPTIAAQIAAIQDPSKKAAKAMEIFGKSGTQLLPMMADLKGLTEQARRLGLVMDGDAAEAADQLGDAFDQMTSTIKAVRNAIGVALAPVVQNVTEQITGVISAVRNWVADNQELFASIFKIAAVVTGVGAAITGLGLSIFTVGVALGGFNSLLGIAWAAIGALTSPIGLVVAALAGLVTWFATATEWGRSMVASLAGWFGDLWRIAKDTFGGIADALAAGDLALAGKVAMAGLQVAWLQGTNWLRNKWSEFKDFFLRTTTEMVFAAQEYWIQFANAVKSVWASMVTTSKSVGESIGHWLTRSDDPELAADQDAAHNEALQRIEREGQAEQNKITAKKEAELAAIDAARQTASAAQDDAFNKEMSDRKSALEAAKKELAGLRQSAAQGRLDTELKNADRPTFEPLDEVNLSTKKMKDQVFGSFSAAALAAQGVGGGSGIDRWRDEFKSWTREERNYYKQMLEAMREGGALT